MTDGIFTTNLASKGGGIYNFSGTLTVTNSTLSSNSASNSGGGIYNNTGSLTMTNSTLFNNSAGYSGGSIANLDEMMVVNSTLFNNSAAYAGGIYSYSGTVMNSVLYNNSATYGGGISNYGPLTVMNSTLSNNLATYSGGGIYNWGALTVTNSTLSNNSANNGGGISNNYAATTLLYNTLIVDSPSGLNCVRSGGTLTANSFNMDTDGSCDNAAEMSSAQINLQPLSDNGGPTQTHALGAGSLAIDAGNDSNCPATDQRVTRPQGGHCDIGAYEKIVHYVKSNAGGLNDGSSWTNAYTDLQSALSVASSGDEIWVAAGTYKPTRAQIELFHSPLKNGVAIYGGFAGTENLCNQRNWELNITTLSGDIGVLGDNIDNSYHVVIGVSGAILDGLCYRCHADGTNSPHWHGGGMLNVSGSSPTLTNLILAENFADNDGGGMANLWNSSPLLTNVIFIHNKASGGGGGMYSQDGNSTLYNVVFENNEADIGGGLLTSSDYSTLMNVTFGKNKANFAGGGMFNSHGSPMLANVTFSGNSATHHGGGMVTDYYNAPMLNNVTFANNTAGYQAGGISITNVSEAIITNAIFWNNSAPDGPEIYIRNSAPTISNSIVEGGCPTGITCNNVINANPKLDILTNNGGLTKTQALLTGSPAIDAGDDATCAATDQRGVTRPQGSHCDIGAYEYNSADVNVTIGGNSVGTYSLDPGERTSPRYGINGGPVHVVSTNAQPILTSQRAVFGSSFNSIVGYPGNQLTTEYWFTSLDDLGMITYLVIGNPSTTLTAHVDVYIAGNKMNPTPYAIAPGQRVFPRYGINGGPVHVVSDIPIFTSERTKYGNSFNEVLGYPANQLTTEYWFTSLDDLGMITYLVIGNPSTTQTATVNVYIAGNKMNPTPYLIAPGQRVFPRYGINGGPVQVVARKCPSSRANARNMGTASTKCWGIRATNWRRNTGSRRWMMRA
ncbi:MAG: hypothetical protein IPP66_23320 [Anaerolineales bacterium]|nr:hypothetical protein [Anaerolineales bacterium]